jgi:hypothetical protein
MATPEFLITNLVDTADAISASSEETALAVENVQSKSRTKVWRSDSGWNIITGVNDKIDITEGVTGDATATLTAGNYATGALMATEAQTQINAAATDNTWTCTYSSGTRKFTIGHDNVQTGGLEWSTGANAATSAGIDLGYDTSADDTGAASYVGDNECRCSREYIGAIDLGSATRCRRAAIINHNFSSAATVGIYRHTSDDLPNATLVQNLAYDAKIMVLEFDATYRYWWFHVQDIDNSDSYIEAGRPFLGGYSTLTAKPVNAGFSLSLIDPSVPTQTPEGVVGRNERNKFYRLGFNLAYFSEADRDTLLTVYDTIGAYNHFILRLDPSETVHSQDEVGILYGYFTSRRLEMDYFAGTVNRWSAPLTFEEAR